MEKLLLKPGEAADLLGIGRAKVYALLAGGELPAIRVGHSVRVPAAALERWVEDRAQSGSPSREPEAAGREPAPI